MLNGVQKRVTSNEMISLITLGVEEILRRQ